MIAIHWIDGEVVLQLPVVGRRFGSAPILVLDAGRRVDFRRKRVLPREPDPLADARPGSGGTATRVNVKGRGKSRGRDQRHSK